MTFYKLILLGLYAITFSKNESVCIIEEIAQKNKQENDRRYIDTLRQAMMKSETFFIKVHAAEALIENGYTKGIESAFIALQNKSTGNLIGSARVLAKLNKNNPALYKLFIHQIVDQFLYSDSFSIRLMALESLGKLGYYAPLPQIHTLAENGEEGMKPMACWVLSNSGQEGDESKLATLLLSEKNVDYRYSSYAFRFKNKISPASYALLDSCFKRIAMNDPERVFVLGSLYVHALPTVRNKIRNELITYLKKGTAGEKYLAAEAMGIKGSRADTGMLKILLDHSNRDVRVAAANAILKINKRI